MSSTYSGNPANSDKDAVRFLTGDTGPTTFEFSDEEILFALETEGNKWLASALLCERVAAGQSGGLLTSKRIGSLSESYSTASSWFENAAKYYRQRGGSAGANAVPTFNDRMPQYFSMKQFDNPGGRGPRVKDDTEGLIPQDDEDA